jgi:hypothetical protein
MIKRRSKIAKLPKDIQLQLNTMLDEGATYPSIVDWLATKGCPDITVDTLYQWKEGGFQDWLAQQQQTERAKALFQWEAEFLLQHPEVTPHSAAVLFGTCQLKGLLDEIDVLQAQGAFSEHPENYTRCFNSLARFARISFEMQQHKDRLQFESQKHRDLIELRAQTKEAKDQPPDPEKPITEKSLDKIEKKLNLL